MLVSDGLIHFGALYIAHGGPMVATVAITEHYLSRVFGDNKRECERREWMLAGMMDQGMQYNPVLRLFNSWEELPKTTNAVDLSGIPAIVLG